MTARRMDLAEFEEWFATAPIARTIRYVDTHHTYIPRHRDEERLGAAALVEAMRRFHTLPPHLGGNGWSDIGQHWTVARDGGIWTGRPLDRPPCSQSGFNAHALMYEMIGNFCAPGEPNTKPPYDTLGGPQRAAAVGISAAVVARFRLPLLACRFHRQLHVPGAPPPKTCPGYSVDFNEFISEVEAYCWQRWLYDPAGGVTFDPAASFDPADREGSAHDAHAAAFDLDRMVAA